MTEMIKWLSIKDNFPNQFSPVLCIWHAKDKKVYKHYYFENGRWWISDSGSDGDENMQEPDQEAITHWMPWPKPPAKRHKMP